MLFFSILLFLIIDIKITAIRTNRKGFPLKENQITYKTFQTTDFYEHK